MATIKRRYYVIPRGVGWSSDVYGRYGRWRDGEGARPHEYDGRKIRYILFKTEETVDERQDFVLWDAGWRFDDQALIMDHQMGYEDRMEEITVAQAREIAREDYPDAVFD